MLGTPNEASSIIDLDNRVRTQVQGDHTYGPGGSDNTFFTAPNEIGNVGVEDVDGEVCVALSPTYTVAEESTVAN